MNKLCEGPEADCLEPKEEERALGEDRMSGRGGDEKGRGGRTPRSRYFWLMYCCSQVFAVSDAAIAPYALLHGAVSRGRRESGSGRAHQKDIQSEWLMLIPAANNPTDPPTKKSADNCVHQAHQGEIGRAHV